VPLSRWILPEIHIIGEEGEVQWVEAQVPDVTEEKRKRFDELAGVRGGMRGKR
jgi:hypothetical protein